MTSSGGFAGVVTVGLASVDGTDASYFSLSDADVSYIAIMKYANGVFYRSQGPMVYYANAAQWID
jgi:hypothetical protein